MRVVFRTLQDAQYSLEAAAECDGIEDAADDIKEAISSIETVTTHIVKVCKQKHRDRIFILIFALYKSYIMREITIEDILKHAGYVKDGSYRGPNAAYVRFDDLTRELKIERFFITGKMKKCFAQYTDEVLDTNTLIRKYPALFKEYTEQKKPWQLVKEVCNNTWNDKYKAIKDAEAEEEHEKFFADKKKYAEVSFDELLKTIRPTYSHCSNDMGDMLANREAKRLIEESQWWIEHEKRIKKEIVCEMKRDSHFTYETARSRAIATVEQGMDGMRGNIKFTLMMIAATVLFIGVLIICWPIIRIIFTLVFGYGSIGVNILMDNY